MKKFQIEKRSKFFKILIVIVLFLTKNCLQPFFNKTFFCKNYILMFIKKKSTVQKVSKFTIKTLITIAYPNFKNKKKASTY